MKPLFLKHLLVAQPLLGSKCYQKTLVWDVLANKIKGWECTVLAITVARGTVGLVGLFVFNLSSTIRTKYYIEQHF